MVTKRKKRKKKILKKKTIKEKLAEIINLEPDPRRSAFAAAYYDSDSDTYANAYQSAIKAGFGEEYARVITSINLKWVSDIIRNLDILEDARRNLKEDLNMTTVSPILTPFGPYKDKKTKKMVYLPNSELIAKRQKATTFVLEATDETFRKTQKVDITSGGKRIQPVIKIIKYDSAPEKE